MLLQRPMWAFQQVLRAKKQPLTAQSARFLTRDNCHVSRPLQFCLNCCQAAVMTGESDSSTAKSPIEATPSERASGDAGRLFAASASSSVGSPGPSADALAALAAAMDFADQALSPATLRAYRADWRHFCEWCQAARWSPLPAEPENGRRLSCFAVGNASQQCHRPPARGAEPRASAGEPGMAVGPSGHPQYAARHPPPPRQAAAAGGRPCDGGDQASYRELRPLRWSGSVTVRCCCWAMPAPCAAPNWSPSTTRISPLRTTGCGC